MNLHANAALSLKGRRELCHQVVDRERTVTQAALAAGVSVRCARKWVGRYRAEGDAGLRDRSSAPHRIPHRTTPERVQVICQLRRLRMTGAEIAEVLGMALSTVSVVLKRSGMGKLGRLGLEPAERYEHDTPGALIHIDVKKLGRIHNGAGHRFIGAPGQRAAAGKLKDRDGHPRLQVGWEYVHIAIDDCTRLAYAEVLTDERAITAVAFLRRATAFYGRHGITVQRLITDNGSPYRSTIHALACRALGIRHLRTRPRRPQTNGKAERFIRTMLNGWAYGAIYRTSKDRTAALDGWLWHYNHQRRHSALGHQPPAARLNERTNLPGSYT
jgi:transposase InsO family protein/transposase